MTLENLLKTGQLKSYEADAKEVRRLLDAARRNLRDSAATNISPDTKRPGHHAVAIQALPKAIGIAADRIAVLDTLRRKRNLSDYTGEDIDSRSVDECRGEAKRLLDEVSAWLKKNRPELAA